jgi:hypothetical protein
MTRIAALSIILLVVALGAVTAQGTEPDDFAWSWTLSAESPGTVWRVPLDEAIMTSLHRADGRDLLITDASNQPVPFGLLPDELLSQPWTERLVLPTQAKPVDSEQQENDPLEMTLRYDGVELLVRSPSIRSPATDQARLVFEALIGNPHRGERPGSHHLELELGSEHPVKLDCRLREAEDERPASTRAEFTESGDTRPRRFRARVPVEPLSTAWHLACYANQAPDDLELTEAVLFNAGTRDHRRQQVLDILPGAVDEPAGAFEFELPGPFRVRAIELSSDLPNLLSELVVQSRLDESSPWRARGRITLSTLADSEPASLRLEQVNRERHWRLLSTPALSSAPSLAIVADVEELVFLAQGQGPWQLFVGSLKAVVPGASPAVLAETRDRLGPAWTWPVMDLGERQQAAGPDVLLPQPEPIPWQRHALWMVLVFGALLVAVFALRLLRQPDAP